MARHGVLLAALLFQANPKAVLCITSVTRMPIPAPMRAKE
jgi:hypothetical protein